MRKLRLLSLLFLTFPLFSRGQETAYIDPFFANTQVLTAEDAMYLGNLPVLELPEILRSKELPAVHDNSVNEYFRPIFSQEVYPNCMQSSSIAYNFTYEINRMRQLPADVPENQYTTHFTWNFLNGGQGWYGVNYLHTHEILYRCGTPNLVDYDGFYTGGGQRWMSGYDKYHHAMQNRIEGVYAIPVTTEDGLLTLKHWLYDHLEGSAVGGVANYIACSPWNYTSLPAGTPEAGKKVVVAYCPEALHGMTIVGWNDSICYDYNGDTRYTNNEDITGDGVVDMQDWEIGGLKFANSYGDYWADSGFCYMMYRTLAAPIEEGGIWNNAVHVLKTKADYQPLLTMKVRLKHNAREMIRIRTGVSTDPEIGYPTDMLDLPIFQFQGMKMSMQGCDSSESCKTIEFGLDVTPLLSHVIPGQEANYFIQVYERDPMSEGTGELLEFTLVDHTSGTVEIPYPIDNIPLVDNGLTSLMITRAVDFDPPVIITDALPAFQASQTLQVQLEADGGSPPYKWKLRNKYTLSKDAEFFPAVTGQQLMPNTQGDSIFAIPLGFQFPFYGELYDTVRVNALGYLFFDESINHWPYMKQESFYFRHIKAISPFKSKALAHYPYYDDGLWYELSQDHAIFRWKMSIQGQDGISEINTALKLEASGRISLYYNGIEYEGSIDWAGGISYGNGIDYQVLDISDPRQLPPNTLRQFIQHPVPAQLSLSEGGLLSITADDPSKIYDVHVEVSDQNNIKASKYFQLSDAILASYSFNADDDTIIHQGSEVLIDYSIRNIGQQVIDNLSVTISSEDDYVTLEDDQETFGTLSPGQTKTVTGALRFSTSMMIPDGHAIVFENKISGSAGQKENLITAIARTPSVRFVEVRVEDDNDGRLDPGEAAELIISIMNEGHANASAVSTELVALNDFVTVQGNPVLSYGLVAAGMTVSRTYSVYASPNTLNGYEAKFLLKINEVSGIQWQDTLQVMVGKKPVLIIDLAPNHDSGPVMLETLNQLGIYTDYSKTFPPSLDNYQSVFLSLGIQLAFYELTLAEGAFLAEYLEDGGKIYLESRRIWRDDLETPLQGMFNIDIINIPTMFEVVQGIDSTFTQGMAFLNLASPPFNYYSLDPVPPAFNILQSQEDSLSCAVAHDAGTYKTIGAVIEFGKMLDDTSHKADLMEQYLFFFDIKLTTIGIDEPMPGKPNASTHSYPNPFRDQVNISFTLLEGSEVNLAVFDINGQRVQDLIVKKRFPGGTHVISWSPGMLGLPAGIYLYRLVTGREVITRKMILID